MLKKIVAVHLFKQVLSAQSVILSLSSDCDKGAVLTVSLPIIKASNEEKKRSLPMLIQRRRRLMMLNQQQSKDGYC